MAVVTYKPDNAEHFEMMLKDARSASRPMHLRTSSKHWLFDLSYSYTDVEAVIKIVEEERGWSI